MSRNHRWVKLRRKRKLKRKKKKSKKIKGKFEINVKMFSTFVCLCVSDGCTREMLLVRESESLCAVYPRKFESRLPGQDTCEGAVAVKIIHPEPGQPSSNSQAGPVTPYQQAGTVQASLTSPGRLDL